ncbi:MAG: Na+:solute symporter, partial [Bacteroidales bacterium]|nr:Na+:solute symporter [Bacteroidales bacterium]
RWSKLRESLHIQSPTEFLSTRYNLSTQQVIAWSGVLLKLFDIGAKWAAIAIILNVFTGLPIFAGVLLSGGISMIYVTIGGLWADVWNDFAQFIVQIIAGITMFVVIFSEFNGFSGMTDAWNQLPEANRQVFNHPYTLGFALTFLLINFLTYNGGTWNLAMRYISSPTGSTARKAALLSASLYLVWPLILFIPMWFAPILLPGLEDPTSSYPLLAQKLLPDGLVGLVLAGMFANTMSMTASDSNTISSVITRDILPHISSKVNRFVQKKGLLVARITTLTFTALTLVIAMNAESFGGVLGLIITWFGALVGPVAIPMVLGLLPIFRHSGPRAAIISILSGFVTFVLIKYFVTASQALQIASPALISLVLYSAIGFISRKKEIPGGTRELLSGIQ